jgi:hypothetical protein
VARSKSKSTPIDRDLALGEAELEALADLLAQLYPKDSTAWTAVLNALVMEGETLRPREAVVAGLVQAITSLGVPSAIAGGVIFQLVRPLLKALALPLVGQAPLTENEAGFTYSFGPQMTHLVVHLRNVLGLSKLFVYRHLRYEMDIRMPTQALMQNIASIWSIDEIAAAAERLGITRK